MPLRRAGHPFRYEYLTRGEMAAQVDDFNEIPCTAQVTKKSLDRSPCRPATTRAGTAVHCWGNS
eukprot:scaffold149398_cov47-Prasinocladus_malaysianus.AAC.1